MWHLAKGGTCWGDERPARVLSARRRPARRGGGLRRALSRLAVRHRNDGRAGRRTRRDLAAAVRPLRGRRVHRDLRLLPGAAAREPPRYAVQPRELRAAARAPARSRLRRRARAVGRDRVRHRRAARSPHPGVAHGDRRGDARRAGAQFGAGALGVHQRPDVEHRARSADLRGVRAAPRAGVAPLGAVRAARTRRRARAAAALRAPRAAGLDRAVAAGTVCHGRRGRGADRAAARARAVALDQPRWRRRGAGCRRVESRRHARRRVLVRRPRRRRGGRGVLRRGERRAAGRASRPCSRAARSCGWARSRTASTCCTARWWN